MKIYFLFVIVVLFFSNTCLAEDDWLITPKEYNEFIVQQDDIEEVNFITLTSGPHIDIIKPKALNKITSPVHIKVIFQKSSSNLDPNMNSLKIIYHSFIKKNLNKKLKKYIKDNVLDHPKAKLPKGLHKIELYIEDMEGNITNRMMQILVIKK